MVKSIKLYKGQKFKNYKELCEIMEWKVVNSNSKKAQFKQLDRLCKYKINPNKSIVILEVFEVKKDKVDNRGKQSNRSIKYKENIGNVILLECLKQNCESNNRLIMPKSILMKKCGLINENYQTCKHRSLKTSKYLDIDYEIVDEYFSLNNRTLVNTLESGIKYLVSRKLINFNVGTMICKNKVVNIDFEHREITDKTGEVIDKVEAHTNFETIYELADENERNIIIAAEKKLLNQYKCKNVQELFSQGKVKSYYKDVTKEIRLKMKDFNFYFSCYDLVYNFNDIVEALEELHIDLDDIEQINNYIETNKDIINRNILNQIDKNTISRKNKALDNENNKKEYRTKEKYVENTNKISDTVINPNTKVRKNDIRSTVITKDDIDNLNKNNSSSEDEDIEELL